MRLSGDLCGDYLVEEHRSDGRLVLRPDLSVTAMLARHDERELTTEEFEQHFGSLSSDTHNFNYRVLLFESLTSGRSLDRQNAHPVAIAKDFERFGVDIWEQVDTMRRATARGVRGLKR